MRNKQHIKRCPMCGGKAGIYQDYHSFYLVQCNRVMSLAKAGRVQMAQHDNRETYFIDNKPIFTIAKYMRQNVGENKITYTFREEVLGNGLS